MYDPFDRITRSRIRGKTGKFPNPIAVPSRLASPSGRLVRGDAGRSVIADADEKRAVALRAFYRRVRRKSRRHPVVGSTVFEVGEKSVFRERPSAPHESPYRSVNHDTRVSH